MAFRFFIPSIQRAVLLSAFFMLLLMLMQAAHPVQAQQIPQKKFTLEIESGAVWQGKNDIEIPGDGSADRFSVPDLIGQGPSHYYRIYLSLPLSERQDIRLLFAPLTISGEGMPPQAIRFENETFAAGVPLTAKYTFNSYRITYRYLVTKRDRFLWHIGFTAKIRDAKVELANDLRSAENSNVGFVPLLHISLQWNLSSNWSAVLDADALAAPQGRAEDVALKLSYDITDGAYIAAGYRGLEGGADNDEVYTFAWLHYAALSFGLRF